MPFLSLGAVEIFLRLNGIDGEAKDILSKGEGHDGEIVVLDWSWGVTSSKSGAPNFAELKLRKYVDKASPKLMQSCATSTLIADGSLAVRKEFSTGNLVDYLVIDMENILVTSVHLEGAADASLIETITLTMWRFVYSYIPDNLDSQNASPETTGYDIPTNQLYP